MRKLNTIGLCLLSVLLVGIRELKSQEVEKPKAWKLKGYLKELVYLQLDKGFVHAYPTNLLHQRLNFSWKAGTHFNTAAELRNRLYWGDEVRLTPGFSAFLNNTNEQVTASVHWMETGNAVLHTNVERLWMEYANTRWNIRLGRQRINWAMASIWNPNDIFNTYNFIDFDYEERPGIDAIRIRYFIKELSYAEAAFSIGKTNDKNVAGIRYFFNTKGFDGQVNAGYYRGCYTAGLAWAGSIKAFGFKGEIQHLSKHELDNSQTNIAIEWDYMHKIMGYWALSFLWNSNGIKQPVKDWEAINLSLSPRNPMPTALNLFLNANKKITPLFNASLSVVFAPITNILILMPTLSYNITNALDVNLVGQSFFAETHSEFSAISHRSFLRLRWSY